jgi:hypothetical protein
MQSLPLSKHGSILAFGKPQEAWGANTQQRSPTMLSNISNVRNKKDVRQETL